MRERMCLFCISIWTIRNRTWNQHWPWFFLALFSSPDNQQNANAMYFIVLYTVHCTPLDLTHNKTWKNKCFWNRDDIIDHIQAIRFNLQNTNNSQQKIKISQNQNETQWKMIIINDVFPFPSLQISGLKWNVPILLRYTYQYIVKEPGWWKMIFYAGRKIIILTAGDGFLYFKGIVRWDPISII